MDIINILFIVALIYFFSSLQKRKKQRNNRSGESPQKTDGPEQIPENATVQTQNGYDYEQFRKKLRRAWKLPETDSSSKTEAPRTVSAETEQRTGKPEQGYTARQTEETVSSEKSEMTEQVRRWQEYARRREASVSVQAIQEAAGGQETGTNGYRWSERDTKQWMVYDAVFGEPACRRIHYRLRERRRR